MRRKLLAISILILTAIIPACQKNGTDSQAALTYPVTKKVEQMDDYFGTKVEDPYRWLEDDTADDVKQWVEAQNKVTFAYLDSIPFRDKIHQRLTEVYNYPKYSSPFRAGDYYFFYKNDGLQNQSVIYVQKGLDGEPEVFIDPNLLASDGTVRIFLVGFSKDNKYVTYSKSEAGSDWQELRVMEIATKKELSDRIRWVKFTPAAWYGNGFFYSGFDKPETGQELSAANRYQKVFYHALGDPQDSDKIVYEDKDHPFRYMSAQTTEDKKYLFLSISEGTHGNELQYATLTSEKLDFRPLIQGFEFDSYVIDNIGDKFLVYTNADAPNYRVVMINPQSPEKKNWKTVIPEEPEVLNSASTAGGQYSADI